MSYTTTLRSTPNHIDSYLPSKPYILSFHFKSIFLKYEKIFLQLSKEKMKSSHLIAYAQDASKPPLPPKK